MTTTVCPICNHPTRYPRSNPNQWECPFCGTKASPTALLSIDTMPMYYGKNGRLNSITTTKPVPGSFTAVEKPGGLKYDDGKLRYDLVPPHAIKAIADVLTYGADKYAPNNWQTVSDGETRYTAAMMRHFEAYREGEELDPETGKSHLSHCLCNLTFLLWFQQNRLRDS